MTTYLLPENGTHTFNDAYNYNDHCLNFQGVDGQVIISARPPGSAVFYPVPNGIVDIANPHMVRFTGAADEYQFELSGASAPVSVTGTHTVHGQGVNYRAVEATVEPVLRSGVEGFERIRVDDGEAGWWMGQQFELGHVYTIPNGGQTVVKLTYPVDTIILSARLSVDQGSAFYRVYKGDTVTEATPFATPLMITPLCTMSFTPAYIGQVSIQGGGTLNSLTDIPYQSPMRLRSAGATAQQSSIGDVIGDAKGVPAGSTSYIVLSQLSGTNGATSGVLRIKFEERTFGY